MVLENLCKMYKISDPTLSLTTIHNGGKIVVVVVVAGLVANFVAVFATSVCVAIFVADVVALVLEMVYSSEKCHAINFTIQSCHHLPQSWRNCCCCCIC